MSQTLSQRKVQPGTKNTGKKSEYAFEKAVGDWIVERSQEGYDLRYFPQTRALSKIFGKHGVRPEGMLMLDNKYVWFFEVKYQKAGGNAQERVYRLYTPLFQRAVSTCIEKEHGYTPQVYPYSAIFTGSLATGSKYKEEFETCLEPYSYLRWENSADTQVVYTYLDEVLVYLVAERNTNED